MHTTTDDPPSSPRPESTFPALAKSRSFIAVLAVILLSGITFIVRYIPAKIASYDELESWVDRRVEFVGVFDGDQKAYDLIVFQGRPIVFQHTLGAIEWSPDTGEQCRVVGRLKRYGRPLYGVDGRVDYILSQAEYYPELQE